MPTYLPEVIPIRKSSRALVREFGVLKASGRGHRISFAQGHALVELDAAGELTASDLGRILRLNRSSTSRTLNELRRKGWISTRDTAGDSRKRPFVLTTAGKARLKELQDRLNLRVHKALELLSKSERQAILKGITLYVEALQRTGS